MAISRGWVMSKPAENCRRVRFARGRYNDHQRSTSALRFVDQQDSKITKALGPSGITEDGEVKVAYTTRLNGDDVAGLGCVSVTVTTLQEFVCKTFEVRLTVIGDRCFPITIHATTEVARIDWRSEPSALTYEFVALPDTVIDGVLQYMKRMNLSYAGLDFVVTRTNDG